MLFSLIGNIPFYFILFFVLANERALPLKNYNFISYLISNLKTHSSLTSSSSVYLDHNDSFSLVGNDKNSGELFQIFNADLFWSKALMFYFTILRFLVNN